MSIFVVENKRDKQYKVFNRLKKTKMELNTAIEILEYHQEWRIGKREDMIHEPKKLTEALDIVLSEVKKFRLGTVSNTIAIEYAKFCVRCDREKLPLICLEDYIKHYCC